MEFSLRLKCNHSNTYMKHENSVYIYKKDTHLLKVMQVNFVVKNISYKARVQQLHVAIFSVQ